MLVVINCIHFCDLLDTYWYYLKKEKLSNACSRELVYIIVEGLPCELFTVSLQELKIFSRDVLAIMKFVYKLLKSLELSIAQSFGPVYEHDTVTSICTILDYYYSSQRFAAQLDSIKNAFFTDSSLSDSRKSFFNTLLLCGDAMLKSLQPVTIKQIDQFQNLFSGVS